MLSKCKESITNGCPLNHKLLSGTPELLELRTAGAPDCRCSRLLEHRANIYLDLHFIGLRHMGRNTRIESKVEGETQRALRKWSGRCSFCTVSMWGRYAGPL